MLWLAGGEAWMGIPSPVESGTNESEHPEMELAAKTWGGEWWKFGGGGTAWNSLVYDEELNSLYIGVGNGAPWPRQIRSGDAWERKSPDNPLAGDDLFLTAITIGR